MTEDGEIGMLCKKRGSFDEHTLPIAKKTKNRVFDMQKQILEPYRQGSPDVVAELYIEANEDPGFRSEHEDYQGCYLFLHWLAYAIKLILDAQKTGQIFCVGVYGNFYVGVKVEAAFLLPYVKTLSDLSSDRRLVAEVVAAIYNWLGRKSDLRALLNLLGQGGVRFLCSCSSRQND